MLDAIVGLNWGDEGKGRIVDLFAQNYDCVCRYQGGNNAGHTVINSRGSFVLNLIPSGIFNENTVNIMGNGMLIDIEHLYGEIQDLLSKGIKITPDNLKISEKAFICLPYHKAQDNMEEDRLADRQFGSTRRGIAYGYGDKYLKRGIRMGDLLHLDSLTDNLTEIVAWKNFSLSGYGQTPIEVEDIISWLNKYGLPLKPFITDITTYLEDAISAGKNILFEAQLGALRDIDYGIYPYTTSSQTLAAYAPIGAGIPGRKLDKSIGILKAYSSCVGEGPFVSEFVGEDADKLREAGSEYGAATGRKRRVGAFDIPASTYGVRVQGATEVILTKLDVLAYMEKIPVCVAYMIDGERTTAFPQGDRLARATPVIEYLEGFNCDIQSCRSVEELPQAALDYINYLQNALSCKFSIISVGPERDEYIVLP